MGQNGTDAHPADWETMMDERKKLMDRMRHQRGHDVPEWSWLSQADPEYMAAFNVLIQRAFGYYGDRTEYPDALSPKIKELIAIAILAGQRDTDRLGAHLRRAVDLGTTDKEILEALQIAVILTGGPAIRLGVLLLERLRGNNENPPAKPSSFPSGKNERREGEA